MLQKSLEGFRRGLNRLVNQIHINYYDNNIKSINEPARHLRLNI